MKNCDHTISLPTLEHLIHALKLADSILTFGHMAAYGVIARRITQLYEVLGKLAPHEVSTLKAFISHYPNADAAVQDRLIDQIFLLTTKEH